MLAGTIACAPQSEGTTVQWRTVPVRSAPMQRAGYEASTVDRTGREERREGDRVELRKQEQKPRRKATPRRRVDPRDEYQRHPSRWTQKLKAKYA